MSHAKGSTLPVHNVACLGCRAPLKRKTYWRNPWCQPCRKKRRVRDAAARHRELLQQARCFRLILHDTDYTMAEFADLRAEIQRSVIAVRGNEDRAVRFDERLERRAGIQALLATPLRHLSARRVAKALLTTARGSDDEAALGDLLGRVLLRSHESARRAMWTDPLQVLEASTHPRGPEGARDLPARQAPKAKKTSTKAHVTEAA